MAEPRLLIWAGTDDWLTEAATVQLDASGLVASGTQIALDPVPYRLDYTLQTDPDFVTGLLEVTVHGTGWRRRLTLSRHPSGEWSQATETHDGPGIPMPPPGGDMAALADALDCDLGLSPLTNTMPVLRERLNREPGSVEFQMAWVSVPSLAVTRSRQRYDTVRVEPHGSAIVRYSSDTFTADLEFDPQGFVVSYPGLARRVGD
ncbi:putative glycolipid-binding domain-containing protein [Diaminobutyricimonas sp. TR449]|uniref:putative glycolipid-binding domain-containing protein n=1 Tax=Diaminobutyricimonas sp. TR449 TaxID=2708076 RepID=UPI0014229A21|nr:putative glycolipid-binding domain-containing protein [Diaminobutyricimonas sp. TR449]